MRGSSVSKHTAAAMFANGHLQAAAFCVNSFGRQVNHRIKSAQLRRKKKSLWQRMVINVYILRIRLRRLQPNSGIEKCSLNEYRARY